MTLHPFWNINRKQLPKTSFKPPAPISLTGLGAHGSQHSGVAQSPGAVWQWPARQHRLSLDLAGDQGIEHSAGASFAPNPIYFDPENIVKLAIEGGCNAVASTYGVLGSVARKYAHKIPLIVKINHNEFLSYPNKFDQIMFGTLKQAWI
jgi:hypothetical protein